MTSFKPVLHELFNLSYHVIVKLDNINMYFKSVLVAFDVQHYYQKYDEIYIPLTDFHDVNYYTPGYRQNQFLIAAAIVTTD